MWSYVYDNYYEKYDYFHIGGDDLYLIVENLRLYLESEEIQLASNGGHYLPNGSEDTQIPLFMGRRFQEGGNRKVRVCIVLSCDIQCSLCSLVGLTTPFELSLPSFDYRYNLMY